jgi:hypothetical protein
LANDLARVVASDPFEAAGNPDSLLTPAPHPSEAGLHVMPRYSLA